MMHKKLREAKESLNEVANLVLQAMGTVTVAAARIKAVEEFVSEIGPKDPRSGPFIAKRIRIMLGIEKENEEN